MNRTKKLALNTFTSLIKQFVSVICGFILPRLFLLQYGSSVNGLVSSITQVLSLISIFDAGMGVVIEASLYEPLAKKNSKRINQVMTSGQRFYRVFVFILAIYVAIISLIYPLVVNEFDFIFTFTLIVSISISSFGQYCFGVTSSVLLSADQKSYINFIAYAITNVANTVIGVVLIKLNCSVQIVKLVSSLIYIIRPIYLSLYVNKNYKINWHEEYSEEPIKQKWNGMAQHIAALVVGNTDIVVLTTFSTLKNVSIYSVYFLVINSVKEIINASSAGIKSLLGNMLAKHEQNKLQNAFSLMEWGMHMIIILLFSMTAILVAPFIKLYTRGVNDINYDMPIFGLLLSVAYAIFCLRIPYFTVIQAAGHFKETQRSAIIEAIINIVVSIIAVFKYGIIGVACGTIIAMLYRLIYFIAYLSSNILKRKVVIFIKLILFDIVIFIIIFISCKFVNFECKSYFQWMILSVKCMIVGIVELVIFNLIFYNKNLVLSYKVLISKLKRK